MNPALAPVHQLFDAMFAPRQRTPIGGAALENADRVAYQSARSRDGLLAPLPLTFAEAWDEAHGIEYTRAETLDGAWPSDDVYARRRA